MTPRPRIAFAGMTHLGIVSAVAAASKGFPTLGFDPDKSRVEALREARLPVVEPGLDELFAASAERLEFSSDSASLAAADVVYISADVPTDDEGVSDLTGIERLCAEVNAVIRPDACLVVLCQVPPGFTRGLPRAGGLRLYQVETLVFGRAVERATLPERFIVGLDDPRAPLPEAVATFLGAFGCPILPMRYESAELAKIAINLCLVAHVSVANSAAELCERIGADWGEIAPALKLDRRIGAHAYLAPGLGLSGGNLERDLATFCRLSEGTGITPMVIDAFRANSDHRRNWAADMVRLHVLERRPDAVLGVLGLAYKQDTHSTKNSPSLALIHALPGVPIRVYDPVVPASAAGRPVTPCDDPLAVADGAEAVLVMTPWDSFRRIDPAALAARMSGRTVVDPYGILDPDGCARAGLRRITLGRPVVEASVAGGV